MASPARLNSNFVGVTIDSTDRLICSCELPMALRPSKDGRPICEMLLSFLTMNVLTQEVFRCQKAYQEDQCENKIWVNEEAQVKQRVPRAVPRTPTGPKQRDIASYFPVTPSTNSDNRRSAKTGAESGGKPKGRRADGYGIIHLYCEDKLNNSLTKL
ncbi:hypothetical protein CC78DRAFT_237145 [Lojkania enalia]|uniref:Uncharacterized protein n=1 Tax=Lojkania enalia TaxID=147567 RepID=A0A9P4NAJ0_9PLEO|nr:hypothetical protein CC78DRAFT_237145 [Didymosphaeria enalia]